YGFEAGFRQVTKSAQKKAEKEIQTTYQRIANWETKLNNRLEEEQEWAEKLEVDNPNWWQRWQRSKLTNKIKKQLPLQDIYANLQRLEQLNLRNIKHLLKLDYYYYLRHTLEHHRYEIQQFLKAIRSRTGTRRETFFANTEFEIVLSAFPIWLVSFSDLQRVLPQTKDLFDLVIIDEASQCDIASALPALQRAKRALIVGDPQQLRHVSFLPKKRQQLFAENYGLPLEQLEDELNFRERSLLDLALENVRKQGQVHLLNEHFRSHPRIIQFSNEQFYSDSLRLMTQTPSRQGEESVFIKNVENGKRVKRGYNKNEGEALIFFLRLRMTDEQHLPVAQCSKIGILSPFREQVSWLQRNIANGFSLTELERHQVLIGTAHEFQGEERDLMFLSFALDNESHPSAFLFLNRTDVFNVSITRARREIHLFKSFTQEKLSSNWLITKYLDYVENYRFPTVTATSARDVALQEIIRALRPHVSGRIIPNYLMANIPLDILIWDDEKLLAIDLIAFAGEVGTALTTYQIQILARVGVEVFPLAYSEWLINPLGVIQLIKEK
ncbi:MAG: DEAD/DEAH box helicase, partial [Saprospiraceae bacterium]